MLLCIVLGVVIVADPGLLAFLALGLLTLTLTQTLTLTLTLT